MASPKGSSYKKGQMWGSLNLKYPISVMYALSRTCAEPATITLLKPSANLQTNLRVRCVNKNHYTASDASRELVLSSEQRRREYIDV